MTRPSDKERQEYLDGVIKVFQKLILEAKTPAGKLKHTLGLAFYQASENVIWDLNYTDKYGTHFPKSELLLVFTEALADALVPVVCGGEEPHTSWEQLTATLATLFRIRLLKAIHASKGLEEVLTEEDMLKLMELFNTHDPNRTSKPASR